MSYKLDWDKLLSYERKRGSSAAVGHRNAFELDYDRIVGSSSVRRLRPSTTRVIDGIRSIYPCLV